MEATALSGLAFERRPTMAATTVAHGVLDHNHLVALLASIGAGEEAVQRALRERAAGSPIAFGAHVDLQKQNLAHDVVFRLLLPCKSFLPVGSIFFVADDASQSHIGGIR